MTSTASPDYNIVRELKAIRKLLEVIAAALAKNEGLDARGVAAVLERLDV